MERNDDLGLYQSEAWPEEYARWAEALWMALTPKLGRPKSTGWGSARFEDCEVRLELSNPERRLTIRVIDALPDHLQKCYHAYYWGMGPWSDVDRDLAVERTLKMADQLSVDARRREFE